jgi:hypothetical protein
MRNGFAKMAAAALVLGLTAGRAQADVAPEPVAWFTGDPVIAIGILVVVLAILWYLVSGILGVSSRDKSDEDEAGIGVLEGIDEDDDKPRRR